MFENEFIAVSTPKRGYIYSMLVGIALGALLCVGIGVAALRYENSLPPIHFVPSAHTLNAKKTIAKAKASAAASVAPVTGSTSKVATSGTNIPACTPDTADSSLSILDLTNAAPGLTQVIDPDHHYQIYGNNSDQVRQQIIACAPRLSGDDEFTAYTVYKFSWQYGYQDEGDGQCNLVNAKIGMHIAKVMPALTFSSAASTSFTQQWQMFVSNLSNHEQGHVDLNVQYANQILASLQSFPPSPCSTIVSSVNASINSLVAQLEAKQAAYDDATNHGATQGAILP